MKTIKVILSVKSSNEHYSGGCDYAFVELDKRDVETLLKYRDLFKRVYPETAYGHGPMPDKQVLGSLLKMEFWDNSVEFFRSAQREPENHEFPSWDEWEMVLEDWKPDEDHVQRMECGTVSVWDGCIVWSATIKHTDTEIETCRVHWEHIERWLKVLS